QRPDGAGVSRQGAHSEGGRALPARHRGERVPGRRWGGRMSEPLVRVRGLTKRYGARRALAGVDLEIATPQIVGVVGPDGAGKTTLLRALAGLLEIEARVVTVLGIDVRGDVTALKARVGYVPQAFSLHRDLSVEENLRFTARLHRLPS